LSPKEIQFPIPKNLFIPRKDTLIPEKLFSFPNLLIPRKDLPYASKILIGHKKAVKTISPEDKRIFSGDE